MLNDNQNNNFKQKALSGAVWKLAEKVGMQTVQFVLQLVLARLLLPEEYGLVGLLTIFITLSDVFIQQGFTTALIQKKNADQTDFSSVFFANILLASVIYAFLFCIAPLVASFYNEATLTKLMRVLSLNIIFGVLGTVHNAVLSKALDFRKSFFRNLLNVLTQGIVGIATAYMGFGAWALVFSKISGTLVGSIALWFSVKWRPAMQFSLSRVKALFRFSSKVLTNNLLNTLFNNVHSLIIGRYYTSADLGYYQRGQQMPQALMTAFDGSISEVLYPTLSVLQDDIEALKTALRRSIKTSTFIICPIMMGLIAVAEPLTIVLLTEKWLPCVPFMQLQCAACLFWPMAARVHAINALGRSSVTLKLSIFSKTLTLLCIILCVPYGIYAIMMGTLFASLIDFFIGAFAIKKHAIYTFSEQTADILPNFLLSTVMMIIVMLVGYVDVNVFLKLAIQLFVGVAVYVCGSVIFKYDSFFYLLSVIKRLLHRS